ncbi:MAG: transposase [Pirellulales bacterium]|nr:transposase [Pirellulales bacterium]
MNISFYPKHEYACPNVSRCPHLGGAALGTLVIAADEQEDYRRMLLGQVDYERKRSSRLYEENKQLKKQVEQFKLELKVERQSRFATSSSEKSEGHQSADRSDSDDGRPKKRGAPVGHPGWYRPAPVEYDSLVEVDAPGRCPHCGGSVHLYPSVAPSDHLQEDVVEGVYKVVLYRHPAARCDSCRNWVKQAGDGELLGVSFKPATLLGFEKMLAKRSEPLVDDIAKKIASTDGAVHADETYWTLDADRAYYWTHCIEDYIHFHFDISRAGEVSRNILGPYFEGTLVTDCYSGYHAHQMKAKQKCLAHLARTARDWQKVVPPNSSADKFFTVVREWVRRGCDFYRKRSKGKLSAKSLVKEEAWLRKELQSLETRPLDHEKALTLQGRILRHRGDWLVFIDDPRVPPTNNLAERILRPLVVLRKISFGHRNGSNAARMARLMTVQETAKRHGRRPTDIFYRLYTRPPNQVLRYIYAGGTRPDTYISCISCRGFKCLHKHAKNRNPFWRRSLLRGRVKLCMKMCFRTSNARRFHIVLERPARIAPASQAVFRMIPSGMTGVSMVRRLNCYTF